MAPKVLEHSSSHDRLVVLTATEDSAGEVFRFEYLTRTVMTAPPDHVHADQEERIEVLDGTVYCRIAGKERVLRVGDTIVIPPGVPHAVWNEVASGSRSIGEFRPALDSQAQMEAFFRVA